MKKGLIGVLATSFILISQSAFATGPVMNWLVRGTKTEVILQHAKVAQVLVVKINDGSDAQGAYLFGCLEGPQTLLPLAGKNEAKCSVQKGYNAKVTLQNVNRVVFVTTSGTYQVVI